MRTTEPFVHELLEFRRLDLRHNKERLTRSIASSCLADRFTGVCVEALPTNVLPCYHKVSTPACDVLTDNGASAVE